MQDNGIIYVDDDREEAIIVDVDGTLSHITNGRDPHDASSALEDELDDAVGCITAMAYQNGYKVIILTGRNAEHRAITEKWLELNGVEYDELYTRDPGDDREDAIVKEDIFLTHIEPRLNVKFILEDRTSVVKKFRDMGLKCLQVVNGDF